MARSFSSRFVWMVSMFGGIALAALSLHACSASGSSSDDDGSGANGAGANGSGGNGTGNNGTAGDLGLDAGNDDGALTDANACASETFPGQLVPVDLFVMLDRSSSMTDSGKWTAVMSAFNTFVTSDETLGIGIGINYFPTPPLNPPPVQCVGDPECGLYGPCWNGACQGLFFAGDTSCEPLDYAAAAVPIDTLPGNKDAMLNSLNNTDPGGSATSSQPAMEGAVTYTVGWAQDNPSHLSFIVYSTDGDPTGCLYNNSIAGAASAAAIAAGSTPPVPVFVIGVGSELSSLNEIAQAGGTGTAYLVDTGSDVTQQFIDVLNEIRAAGLCKFQIPTPSGDPDYEKVNVSLIDPNDPENPITIKYVENEAACDPVDGGWYYDNPFDPNMIILCPATCEQVMQTDWAINVLLGCKTITN